MTSCVVHGNGHGNDLLFMAFDVHAQCHFVCQKQPNACTCFNGNELHVLSMEMDMAIMGCRCSEAWPVATLTESGWHGGHRLWQTPGKWAPAMCCFVYIWCPCTQLQHMEPAHRNSTQMQHMEPAHRSSTQMQHIEPAHGISTWNLHIEVVWYSKKKHNLKGSWTDFHQSKCCHVLSCATYTEAWKNTVTMCHICWSMLQD